MLFKSIKKQTFALLGSLIFFATYQIISPAQVHIQAKENKIADYRPTDNGTLPLKKEKQLYLGDIDNKGRATFAHIQLRENDEPTKKRQARLKHNPIGWHNYKFFYEDGTQKAWLMNRGHLIGYQFSGLNDEARNLVPMTAWLNSGNYKGTNQDNPDSMLYYEQRLDSWLDTHPNYYLDYKVTALYEGDELLPRRIELRYIGIDKKGKLLPIQLGGKEQVDEYGISYVTLDNVSPNATLDYTTGTAQNTVLSAKQQEEQRLAEEQAAQAAAEAQRQAEEQAAREAAEAQRLAEQEQRIVYVTQYGTNDVYWYDKNNMPKNTNWDKLVEMTEAEALRQGKRHTTKE